MARQTKFDLLVNMKNGQGLRLNSFPAVPHARGQGDRVISRRHLLIALGAAAVVPQNVLAQSKRAPVLVACLLAGSRQGQGHQFVALKEGLSALGWKEGVSLVLEERWADGRYERLQPFAEELAAKKPAVIVAATSQAIAAAARAAPRTPIVAVGGDLRAAGFVSNLARPGGMITGLSNIVSEVNEKHPELLLAAVPNLRRIGFLGDPGVGAYAGLVERARRATAHLSVEGHFAEAARPEEIEPGIARLAKEGVQALAVMPSPMFVAERQRIVKLALGHRWPMIGGQREWTETGALLAYGSDRVAPWRRAAWYVDRILKGAKPGDLPIEQPTKFELVVNMKTARALGLTIPQPFLMRADSLIE